MNYEVVIGLEVHLHLATQTKAFCGCSTRFGERPNSQTCPVCLGLPGSLPVLNKKALEYAIKVGLALNCKIQNYLKFDRKNYFYPDLPKNYQISQYSLPLAINGFLEINLNDSVKRINIRRVHLEEDAGKLIHELDEPYSLIDYNRSGIPLLEIVSEPDINSPEEAYEYLSTLKLTLKYLDVSDCDMEKGSLRCDANISLRPKDSNSLGVKIELKNMNSFKAVKQALEYEIDRQTELLNDKKKISPETRLWDAVRNITTSMRSKEEAHDYRYFPEPDLVPFQIDDKYIEQIRKSIPELPQERIKRYVEVTTFTLSKENATMLVQEKSLAEFFEECANKYRQTDKLFNWMIGSVLYEINSRKTSLQDLNLTSSRFVELLKLVDDGEISNLAAKQVLTEMIDTGKSASLIIREKGMAQVSDKDALEQFVEKVIKENPNSVKDYLSGKENALMFLIGQVMRKSRGQANPKVVAQLLRGRLNEDTTYGTK